MKRQKVLIFAIVGLLLLPVSSFAQDKTTTNTSTLSKLWNKLTGTNDFKQSDLVGKWGYQSTACTFETENLLKKAGGVVVASQVESKFNDYCKKAGIKQGTCSFTFNSDSTYSAKIGLMKLSGKYRLNTETKWITMSYALGIGKMNAQAVKSGDNLKLMFDADGFLKMMKTMSMFTKDNSIEILAAMADMYDGMLLGFDLDKEK